MALGTYAELQTAILGWLARPNDPLVAPAVPDMIGLFESEANRRLYTGWQETGEVLPVTSDGGAALPDDFAEARSVWINYPGRSGVLLYPMSATQEYDGSITGIPKFYQVTGSTLWLVPPSDVADSTVWLNYLATIPTLSDANPTNWLLTRFPDAYLFGALVEAEPYIGHDERTQIWLARREAVIEGINAADRKARWGGPMQIKAAL